MIDKTVFPGMNLYLVFGVLSSEKNQIKTLMVLRNFLYKWKKKVGRE